LIFDKIAPVMTPGVTWSSGQHGMAKSHDVEPSLLSPPSLTVAGPPFMGKNAARNGILNKPGHDPTTNWEYHLMFVNSDWICILSWQSQDTTKITVSKQIWLSVL
jgi:hypothetical protein